MTKYIAILRGINVGGKRRILMADLQSLFVELGFSNVKTYIQSGNVLFDYKENNTDFATLITATVKQNYGFDVPVIIRSEMEWKALAMSNPFLENKKEDINRLYVTLLSNTPKAKDIAMLQSTDYSPDCFEIKGNNIYGYSAGPFHKSKLSNNLFEKKLHSSATTRNWKTVLKILDLLD